MYVKIYRIYSQAQGERSMPKRDDIKKIMIIGSGPIIIGQACEFDYSGTQACKALKKLGYEIVLVNSNPATIMTDPGMADRTYIEALNVKNLTGIIQKEKPDALLPNLGGQSALNLSVELYNAGVLEKNGVKVIGVQIDAIKRGEDRIHFKNTMAGLGIEMPRSSPAYSVEEAEKIASELGYPVVIRPAYTMGGTGGGLVHNIEELKVVAGRGLAASIVGQILVEESVLGWEELELEVVRDSKNQMITVCFIENVDAIGVHTGDSFCTAPMLTIDAKLQDRLQKHSYDIVEAIGVIGGTNVQFAHDPKTGRVVVIEINPRASRSSALASKATGFPIAMVSAMLASGITLDELPYWRGNGLHEYVPYGDYVVVKFPRWAFEKFEGAQDILGTQMKAVGEVMSIGKTYKEAFQKAIRSLETGRSGLGYAKDYASLTLEELLDMLIEPTSERQFIMYEALKKGASVSRLFELTYIKEWFIEQMLELIKEEESIKSYKGTVLPKDLLLQAKRDGFSDKYLSILLGAKENEIRKMRKEYGIEADWEAVPVSAVEDALYYFSTYNKTEGYNPVSGDDKVMILGGGPNRIGQGIEFDYCCVHAAFALKDMGYKTIMVNCNPETVSTDYDTSDILFFEPLTVEDVLNIYEKEKPQGVIVQFGGQTPLNIARELSDNGVKILGTSIDTIELAEDRDLFRKFMEKAGIPMPESGMAHDLDEAINVATKIGYPVMARPSFVLGGRGMEIVHDEASLTRYIKASTEITKDRPVLIDKFIDNAIEAEADALSDGECVFIPAVMEHIELAGIHSGDSACVIPSISLTKPQLEKIHEYTEKIAKGLGVIGLINIQYAVSKDMVYVLEANPRASRTVPLVSKVCDLSMARIATNIMMMKHKGQDPAIGSMQRLVFDHYGVKEAVFPFNMFHDVDPVLGPEMRSTGEVLGMADSFGLAYYKAQESTQSPLPFEGTVFISSNDKDKPYILEAAKMFSELGFGIVSTKGTHDFLAMNKVSSVMVKKLHEGRPNILDSIVNKEIAIIINTPIGKKSQNDDSYIRKAAIRNRIPYITTAAAAVASAKGIKSFIDEKDKIKVIKSLQEYHQKN